MLKFLPLLTCVLYCSCSQKFFVQVKTNLPQTQTQHYYYENDTLKIQFNFTDQFNLPNFWFNVQNKLNEPIFIDWQKTVLEINGQRLSFASSTSNIDLQRTADAWPINQPRVVGTIDQYNTSETIILPTSGINSNPYPFFNNDFLPEIFDTTRTEQINNKKREISFSNYNQTNSPLQLRLFCTFKIGDNKPTLYKDFNFWVDNVKNKRFDIFNNDSLANYGNTFIKTKASNAANTLGVIGAIAVTYILVQSKKEQ